MHAHTHIYTRTYTHAHSLIYTRKEREREREYWRRSKSNESYKTFSDYDIIIVRDCLRSGECND